MRVAAFWVGAGVDPGNTSEEHVHTGREKDGIFRIFCQWCNR